MKNHTHLPYRRSIRLHRYDYARAGAYFVTICTQNRECLFGEIENGEIILNMAGQIVESVWVELPQHYKYISLDVFTIMPNHVHYVLWLNSQGGRAGLKPARTD